MFLRFLLAFAVLQSLAVAAATAQPFRRMFEGVWAYGDVSNCARQHYEIFEKSGALVFRGRDGKENLEIIVDRWFDGLTTQTSQSGQVPVGTQWVYSAAGANTIQVQNKTLGRSFNLVRCADGGLPLPVAPETGAAASLVFVQRYFASWNSDNQTALAFITDHYLPEVVYYGKSTPRSSILQQKDKFVRRWPIRSYAILPGSVSTRCGGDGCEITADVDWTCRSVERGAESSGVSTFTLRLIGQGAATMIAMENGAVRSRRLPGASGSMPPPATWTSPPPMQPERPMTLPVPQIDVPPPRF